jgi:hypothetical protein
MLVFHHFRRALLKLNPRKCELFQKGVGYLRHVSPKGVSTYPGKLRAAREWPPPKDSLELGSFLCLCTYYRTFIAGFSDIAKPLLQISSGLQKQKAPPVPEVALYMAPSLGYLRPGEKFIVDTDARNSGLEAAITNAGASGRVVAYYDRILYSPDRSYSVTRRELLQIVKRLEHFRSALIWVLRF